ncbi:hypothetical protein PPACK8108_LOCUS19458 [Phakopsora pachyrhizi]|uniref:Uncharacterized protein n=1 Tax=Phakopsora pachyrhizi TaxID=170000 RepID=A0AAV0BER6_PHAPC|nr:hypothetical protein PPACK8108_LOCUS19458 [Phakopsora pachyrhizi]
MSNQSCPPSDFQQPELQIGPSQSMISSVEARQDQTVSSSATINNNAESLKGPAPSLEVFANFKDLSTLPAPTGPTVLRSERKVTGKNEYIMSCSKIVDILSQALGLTESLPIAPATVIHRMKYVLQDCKKRKKDVNEGRPIPPEDLIDLTSSPEDASSTASFFDLPKSQTLKRPTKKIKLSKLNQKLNQSNTPVNDEATAGEQANSHLPQTVSGIENSDSSDFFEHTDHTTDEAAELPHPLPAVNETCPQMATPNTCNSSDNNSAAVKQTASAGSENVQDKGASSITPDNASTQSFSLIKDEVEKILLPSSDEAWFAPSMIDMSKLDKNGVSSVKKEENIEHTLLLLLTEIQKPNKNHLSRWSNCIASAVQLTAHDLAVPTLSFENLSADDVTSHVKIIEFLENCKSGNPCVEDGDRKLRNDMTLKPLVQLHDSIIDVFITYVIVRGLSSVGTDTNEESSSQCLVESRRTLEKFRSRHNYAPFCLFLVSGIRGLVLAPLNRQFAPGSSCLGFLSAIELILKKDHLPRVQ